MHHVGISGTPGFIVGTELVPGALDVKGLKDLIARGRMMRIQRERKGSAPGSPRDPKKRQPSL